MHLKLSSALDAFSWIKKFCILIKIALRFVPKGKINNIPSLVQVLALYWRVDKSLSEPIMFFYWRICASLGISELTASTSDRIRDTYLCPNTNGDLFAIIV